MSNLSFPEQMIVRILMWYRHPLSQNFHGENCQYECALCLNSGHCLNTPHPFYYSYSIESKHETFTEVFLPQTQCICSSDIFDADAMCCPQGFEPYVYLKAGSPSPNTCTSIFKALLLNLSLFFFLSMTAAFPHVEHCH